MSLSRLRRCPWFALAAMVFCAPILLNVPARADSKKSAPARSAPASKPAAPSRPSGGASKPAGGASTHSSGPTTGGSHSGPTTSGSHGPTTGNPGGSHSPTTSNPGGHTTTATAGHTTTTTGGHATTTNGARETGVHNTNVPAGQHGANGAKAAPARTATGRPAPKGARTVTAKNGSAVTRRPNGRVSDVHDARRNMDIHHNLAGGRRVSVERADHSRIVAERGRRGYIERRYNYHGHEFARRSYYWHGHEYPRYYRGYYYRGAYVHVYAPAFYYPPAYYGWAYNPWPAPVAYGWGWAPNPWYGYYGYYFAPYPVYAGPAFWLTDYLIAAELQAAFAARAAAAADAASIPSSLYFCANGGCGTLAHNGQLFNGTLSNGTEMTLAVTKWDAQSVVLTRADASGNPLPGEATYTGVQITPTMLSGSVSGARDGQPTTGTWTASASAPTLLASNGGGFFGADSNSAPALSPEIKQMVSDEVKGQIALENAEAQQNSQGQDPDPGSSGIERLMSDGKQHVFVAGDSVDVVDESGTECALSDGDVVQLSSPPPADSTDAKVVVMAAKGDKECAKSATVTIQVADLQEMQNHLRETVDQGLQELKDKQGTAGLPAVPASAKAPTTQSGIAQNAPPPEKDGEQAVNQQLSEADQAEKQTTAEADQDGGGTATAEASAPAAPAQGPPPSIAVGQTIDQVTAAWGQPVSVIDLGVKKIYKYKDAKVTFKNGKVSDVE